jgi:hypothetical protein
VEWYFGEQAFPRKVLAVDGECRTNEPDQGERRGGELSSMMFPFPGWCSAEPLNAPARLMSRGSGPDGSPTASSWIIRAA